MNGAKASASLLLATLCALVGASPPTPAPDAPVRSLSVNFIAVTFRVEDAMLTANPRMSIVVSTNDPLHHSLACVDPAKIFQVRLLDASGKTMPMNTRAYVFEPLAGEGGGVPQGFDVNGHLLPTPNPCATFLANFGPLYLKLREIYPKAAHGVYTLDAVLVPPGSTHGAPFAPVTVRL
jgi:hypothetical protein